MQSIVIPEIYGPGEPGKPFLPRISRLIAVPQGASALIQVHNSKTYEIPNVVPWCSPESIPYNVNNQVIYKPDSSVYYGNQLYPEQIVRVSEPFTIRGLDVVQVTIEPFRWNPRDSVLTAYTSLDFNVSFIGGNGHFGEDRLRSSYWDRIYNCNVVNFRSLRDVDYSVRVMEKQSMLDAGYPFGAEFVIIVPDDEEFISAAEVIKDLRQEEGIITEIFTLSEIGSTFQEIEAWIDNAYYCWSISPEAILLLADCNDNNFPEGIPSRTFHLTNPIHCFYTYSSDNYYADTDNDGLPDIVVGRIPARSVSELNNYIKKLDKFEREPNENSFFYDNILVSGNFQYSCIIDHHLLSEITRGFFEIKGKTVTRLYLDHDSTTFLS